MTELELLSDANEAQLLRIRRADVPVSYVEAVADTIALAKYGSQHGPRATVTR